MLSLVKDCSVNRFISVMAFLLCSFVVEAQVLVDDAYVRGLPPGQTTTAAFMQLKNISGEEVIITGAQTGSSESAEIHAHIHHNGMMSMKRVNQIVIPANSIFELKPGGHHLMLIGLKQFLKEGDSVRLSLLQSDGSAINIEAPVRSVLNEHVNHADHSHH